MKKHTIEGTKGFVSLEDAQLVRLCASVVGDGDAAGDLTQETLHIYRGGL